ncbi:hypothetical protein AB0E70_26575 [Streptomyces murinus]|uniref:hypothetical protein n=1 Tax=Streptomyces murinus TaxID=33900 RepID=UPI000A3847F4|nr:hypothetical protein [Streptomyces murinus]
MISHPVAGAVSALQKQALASSDTYELDRIDRALDELLRNPTNASTPAPYRTKSAMGHAYEVLERRRAIVQFIPLEPNYINRGQPDHSLLAAELLAWVNTEPNLTQAERVLLNDLAGGHDAVSLADRQAVPLQRMRERVSRARRRARALWQAAEAEA